MDAERARRDRQRRGVSLACALAAAAWLTGAGVPLHAQNQRPRHQPGWPCTGTVDPSYVRNAEATGGKLLLFQPGETSGMTADLAASQGHTQTVFRASDRLADGVYDFRIPLDSTIESAYFFVSLQCVQFVTILRPSGDELRVDAPEVDYHAFEAIRLVTIKAPPPGVWTVRIAGHGVFSLVVSARTDLGLTNVAFLDGDVPVKGLPPLGKRVRIDATLSGAASDIGFRFAEPNGTPIRTFRLAGDDGAARRTYSGEVALPNREFRLAITGTDPKGFLFERAQNRLFIAAR